MPEAEAILENVQDKQNTEGPVLFTKELPERKGKTKEREKISLPDGMRIESRVEAGTEIGIQVLDTDNKVVGNAWSYFVPSESKYLGKPVIRSRIEVDEAHQSKGIGGALAKKLLRTIEDTGGFVHQVGFTDMGSQRLRKSYEARGYEPFEGMEDLIYKEYPAKEVHKAGETPKEHYEEFLEKVKEETSTKEVLPPFNKPPVRDKTPEQKAAEAAAAKREMEELGRRAVAAKKMREKVEKGDQRRETLGRVIGAPVSAVRRVTEGIQTQQRNISQTPGQELYVGRSLYQPSEVNPHPSQPEAVPNEGYTSEQKRVLERRAADLGLPLDTTNYDNLARSIAEAIAQKAVVQVETPQSTNIIGGVSDTYIPKRSVGSAAAGAESSSITTRVSPGAEAPPAPQEIVAPRQIESTSPTVAAPVEESKSTSARLQEDVPVGVPDYDPNTFGTMPQEPASTYVPKPPENPPSRQEVPDDFQEIAKQAYRNAEAAGSRAQEVANLAHQAVVEGKPLSRKDQALVRAVAQMDAPEERNVGY